MKLNESTKNPLSFLRKTPSKIKAYPKKFHTYSKKKKILLIASLILLIAGAVYGFSAGSKKDAFVAFGTEAVAKRLDITSSITGSAVVKPKDQYSIRALVSGDVLSADFEQGDVITKGDILYKIDASDAETTIENANISHQRSQMDYDKALDNYKKLTVSSKISGVVKNLYVKKGETVNAGTKIADIYDDSCLILSLAFHDADAQNMYVGQNATVRISSNGETLTGVVTDINAKGFASVGNTLVRNVEIQVKNPGVLTNTETATARVGNFSSSSSGTFEYISEETIVAEVSGKIDAVYVHQGSRVTDGSALIHIDSSATVDNLKSSELSLRSSRLSQENAQKRLEDYTITAPISGTVVTKNVKAGDKLDNSNMSTEMAVIYDMSSLECDLAVDELDIKNVALNQPVIITSDALEGKRYNGQVTSISVNGTTSGGVTTYPVTIVILDFDEDLLPGMNIDVEIVTSKAENVLAVPVAAVNRGNTVYVKGEKTEEGDPAPEGFKSVTVSTGAYNYAYIEIVSGLNEGDVVYFPQVQSTGNKDAMADMMGRMPSGMSGGGMPGGRMPNGGGMPSGRMPGMQ